MAVVVLSSARDGVYGWRLFLMPRYPHLSVRQASCLPVLDDMGVVKAKTYDEKSGCVLLRLHG